MSADVALEFQTLPLATPVTVQLKRLDGGSCWQASFATPIKNGAGQFKAKN